MGALIRKCILTVSVMAVAAVSFIGCSGENVTEIVSENVTVTISFCCIRLARMIRIFRA